MIRKQRLKKPNYPSPPNPFKNVEKRSDSIEFYNEIMDEINKEIDKETIEKGYRLVKLFEKLIKR